MNNRYICVFDYETASPRRETCDIIQIAGAVIDDRRLVVLDEFVSWVKPDFDGPGFDKDTIQWHADVRKISYDAMMDKIRDAPTMDVVWPMWVSWVDKYNKSRGNKTGFNAPVPAGFNIIGFDIPITDRYCLQYGPTEKNRKSGEQEPRLFNKVFKFDLMDHMWFWTENISDPEVKTSISLGPLKTWMGFPKESFDGAHDALQDVRDTTKIIIKLFAAQRFLTSKNPATNKPRLNMKGSFSNGQQGT